jgi:hypothetical protein
MTNDALARRRGVEAAIEALKGAEPTGNLAEADKAIKAALTAIHGLNDEAVERKGDKRNSWTRSGWTPDERGLWKALVGARNGAHHSNWPPAVRAVDGGHGDCMRWNTEPPQLQYDDQQKAYIKHLAGRPVLPDLEAVRDLLIKAIPD